MAYFLPWWTALLSADVLSIVYQAVRGQRIKNVQLAFLGILVVSAIWQTVYWLILYPKYFTPFRDLPTPPVSGTSALPLHRSQVADVTRPETS